MRVTFDTNVWNRLVFPERHSSRPNHAALVRLKIALQAGQIHGFISEGFGTVEAIPKTHRARLHAENVPRVETTNTSHGSGALGMATAINARHDLHPGIGANFEEELNEALAIGIKLLPTPYIGLSVPDRLRGNPQIYAEDIFATATYNERFGEVVRHINARGVGEGILPAIAREFTARLDGPLPDKFPGRALIYGVYKYACEKELHQDKEKIEKAFAEAADGDAMAAHIAFGNDYFCTEDIGKSAPFPSIFDANNRAWLKSEYGVEILTAQQLATLF